MAVYTPLTEPELRGFLAQYDLGELVAWKGIAEGVENSNFMVETAQGKFILTLFEKRTKLEELPYFLHLMEWMHERGVICPLPVRSREGRALHALKDKPAAMVTFLEGGGVDTIRLEHLPQLGEFMARAHLAGAEFPHERANALSVEGWAELIEKIGGRADEIAPDLAGMIREELIHLAEHWPSGLPGGPIHADLFPDNVFFVRARGGFTLSGVIDWYFACNDAWAYDLAIVINAWCFDARHRLVPERVAALMQAYTDARALTPEEERALPVLLRGAALRFLLTRAHDKLFHPEGAVVTPKDPMEYVAKLQFFQQHRWHV